MRNKLKDFLEKIFVTIVLIYIKNYIDLDLINEWVDNLIIAISAFSWDINPFTFKITKNYFNGNSSDEGEGSNRQNNNDNNNNNNNPNQDSITSPPYYEEALVEEIRSISQNQSQEYDMLIDKIDLDKRGEEIEKLVKDL
jgi:hypothetical protein